MITYLETAATCVFARECKEIYDVMVGTNMSTCVSLLLCAQVAQNFLNFHQNLRAVIDFPYMVTALHSVNHFLEGDMRKLHSNDIPLAITWGFP